MGSDADTLITNDHRSLEGLLTQLRADTGDRRALVEEVTARLTTHEQAETEHLLNKVRNLIDSPHFAQALDDFVAAVKHHDKDEGSEAPPVRLTDATRDELYALAKQADIAGRSKMNKDQLVQALRERQG